MIYFTSDTHYGHENICRGTSKWEARSEEDFQQNTRDFKTLEEMNNAIVDGINSVVCEDDVLYHLGDWSFGGIKNIWEFRKRIKCKNIHLILGNHDHHIENDRVLPNCTVVDPEICYGNTDNIIDWTIGKPIDEYKVGARELFSSVNHVKTVKINKHTFFLSHFSHRVWNQSHHGVIHLYGHSHNSIDNNWGKSMDVGIDAVFALKGKYRPLSVTEIIEIMDKREILVLDHHNKYTN